MIEIKAYGKLENGCFYPGNSRVYIQQMKDAGNVKDCLLTITGSNKRTPDQNAYAWSILGTAAFHLQQQGYVNITAGMLYRALEDEHCKTNVQNEKTGKTIEMTKPLKEQDTERFWSIIEEFRIGFNQKHDRHLQTPAEFYDLTEDAYELWRTGVISFLEAKKQSEKSQH